MLFKSKYIVLEDRVVEDGLLEVIDGKVHVIHEDNIDSILESKDIIDFNIVDKDILDEKNTNICIDYKENIIAPGFVDTHIHGYSGHDIMDNDAFGLSVISKDILKIGVTSFLPTTLTASVDTLNEVVKTIGDNKDGCKGSKIRGIFLEGPFFTEKYKGAQNPNYFIKPSIEALRTWQNLSNGLIKKVAVAPEYKGCGDFIKEARRMGISVALGHSDATYEEAKEAVDNGANIFVHVYNGMSPLHHRNPGMVGAALSTENTYAELICDGHHVHLAAADVVIKCKSHNKVALVTDCMKAGGMKDGRYNLGEFGVDVKDGTARLDSGNLAGSILKLKDGFKNVINWGLVSPFEAIQMTSLVPAKSVGIDNVCGKIHQGYDADFVIIDSKSYDILDVILDGKIVE